MCESGDVDGVRSVRSGGIYASLVLIFTSRYNTARISDTEHTLTSRYGSDQSTFSWFSTPSHARVIVM